MDDDSKKSLLYSKSSSSDSDKNERGPWVGGPGTRLPWFVESFLSWSVALSMLSISGYQYLNTIYLYPVWNRLKKALFLSNGRNDGTSDEQEKDPKASLPCWLELTTSSRSEQDSEKDRYQQLIDFLQKTTSKMVGWTNEELVRTIRHSEIARRLVSLALRPHKNSTTPPQYADQKKQLKQLWPQLLRLPPPDQASDFAFDVTVILPAFRERGTDVRFKLTRAYHACQYPKRIEIVVVDAGDCENLVESLATKDMLQLWGALKVVKFDAGGGRGPCLNYGAKQATGRLYTFLHADTTLPPHWDAKIVHALDSTSTVGKGDNAKEVRANSCAFSFGIDTTPQGLNGGPYPPGIKAVEMTANWRTQLYSLPYGDQTLSVPAVVFNYVGGFPDQCLMEDYELISLLRRRAALLTKFDSDLQPEKLVIIGGIPAYCSPRRWQNYGVLYVTFMNSKLVHWYSSGMTPDGLFAQYYDRLPPARLHPNMAPWEVELEELVVDDI